VRDRRGSVGGVSGSTIVGSERNSGSRGSHYTEDDGVPLSERVKGQWHCEWEGG